MLVFCDNEAVCYIVNNQTSKDRQLVYLVRRLTIALMRSKVLLRAKHVQGKLNVIADALSRVQDTRELRDRHGFALKAAVILPDLQPSPLRAERLLNSSLSNLSKNSYHNSIAKFEVFCLNSLGCVHWFPASTASVVSFTSSLFIQNYAASTFVSTLSAVSFIHKMHGLPDPTASNVIEKLLQGAAKLRPSRDHRAPSTMTILHKLVVSTSVSTDCYFNSVLMSSIYLRAFYAFLRTGEIIPSSQSTSGDVLQLDQVEVYMAHLTIVFLLSNILLSRWWFQRSISLIYVRCVF